MDRLTELMLERIGSLLEAATRAQDRGYLVTDHGDRVGLLGGEPGAAVVGDVVWNAAQAVVLLRCAAPARVTVANRAALIAKVAAINAARAVPGFVVRDSGVYVENHVLIEPDRTISRITFDRSLDMVFSAMAQFGPELRAIANRLPDDGSGTTAA